MLFRHVEAPYINGAEFELCKSLILIVWFASGAHSLHHDWVYVGVRGWLGEGRQVVLYLV